MSVNGEKPLLLGLLCEMTSFLANYASDMFDGLAHYSCYFVDISDMDRRTKGIAFGNVKWFTFLHFRTNNKNPLLDELFHNGWVASLEIRSSFGRNPT